ncbi:MAG: hypothetical protein N4A49_08640 [Marinifilaceae bacterium]|nr:hypothetical protein [Marinifilaceae bacterium]
MEQMQLNSISFANLLSKICVLSVTNRFNSRLQDGNNRNVEKINPKFGFVL